MTLGTACLVLFADVLEKTASNNKPTAGEAAAVGGSVAGSALLGRHVGKELGEAEVRRAGERAMSRLTDRFLDSDEEYWNNYFANPGKPIAKRWPATRGQVDEGVRRFERMARRRLSREGARGGAAVGLAAGLAGAGLYALNRLSDIREEKNKTAEEEPSAHVGVSVPTRPGRAMMTGAAAGAGIGAAVGLARTGRMLHREGYLRDLWHGFKGKRFVRAADKAARPDDVTQTIGSEYMKNWNAMRAGEQAKSELRDFLPDHLKNQVLRNTGAGALAGGAALPVVGAAASAYKKRNNP